MSEIIPFMFRKNKILSIFIYSLDFDFNIFYLTLENKQFNIFKKSSYTKKTNLPFFSLDYINQEISQEILTTKIPLYKINLYDNLNTLLFSFDIDFRNLKKIRKKDIILYPILMFELVNGYYTTEELYKKNFNLLNKKYPSLIDKFEKIEDNLNLAKSINVIKNVKNFEKKINNNNNLNNKANKNSLNSLQNNDMKMENVTSAFNLITKYQQFLFITEREFHPEKSENKLRDIKNKISIIQKIKEIENIKKLIDIKKYKKDEIIKINENLESKIKEKESNLEEFLKYLKEFKKENKDKEYKKETEKIQKFDLILSSLYYKKIIEISYIFFNKKNPIIFFISNNNKKNEKFEKCLGQIAFLLNYISYIYNIPLKYPFYLRGSKSYIMADIKNNNNIPLFFENNNNKKDNNNNEYVKGMEYLKYNLIQIMSFFIKIEIITVEQKKYLIKSFKENKLYDFFVEFNHIIYNFIKDIPAIDEEEELIKC